VWSFEELMLALAKEKALPELKPIKRTLWLHVHCHQKALAKPADSAAALRLIDGLDVRMIQSGCCGMSGEFGYKHYEVSKAIANQSLLPALADAREEDWIVATGTSCRHQLADLGSHQALHIAQVFEQAC
jgi:Fe-S oxidoreductase